MHARLNLFRKNQGVSLVCFTDFAIRISSSEKIPFKSLSIATSVHCLVSVQDDLPFVQSCILSYLHMPNSGYPKPDLGKCGRLAISYFGFPKIEQALVLDLSILLGCG